MLIELLDSRHPDNSLLFGMFVPVFVQELQFKSELLQN